MEVCSEKLPYVRSLPQGLLFLKNISEILRHAHFQEIELLPIFGQNIHPDTQGDSQEALWRLSEGISQLSGGIWWARSVLKQKCVETIVFFCKSGATDLFHRRMAKVTCTKYRACTQKLFAVSPTEPTLPQSSL